MPAAASRLDDRGTFVRRENRSQDEAVDWVKRNLSRNQTILVDDVVWTDLAAAGWTDQWNGALWFYKLDTDPVARKLLPGGWTEVEYVISTSTLRRDLKTQVSLEQCRRALEKSTVVQTFGVGDNVVEVRRVNRWQR